MTNTKMKKMQKITKSINSVLDWYWSLLSVSKPRFWLYLAYLRRQEIGFRGFLRGHWDSFMDGGISSNWTSTSQRVDILCTGDCKYLLRHAVWLILSLCLVTVSLCMTTFQSTKRYWPVTAARLINNLKNFGGTKLSYLSLLDFTLTRNLNFLRKNQQMVLENFYSLNFLKILKKCLSFRTPLFWYCVDCFRVDPRVSKLQAWKC